MTTAAGNLVNRGVRQVAVAFLAFSVLAAANVAAADRDARVAKPFSFSAVARSRGEATVEGNPRAEDLGAEQAKAHASGTESKRSECSEHADVSEATGSASTKLVSETETSRTFELRASAYARGGHFRRCGSCVLDKCLVISPTYTDANASARAQLTVDVVFESWVNERPFRLRVHTPKPGQNPAVVYSVSGPDGALNSTMDPQGFLIAPKNGSRYRVTASIDVSARNDGVCCPGKSESVGLVSVDVLPAGWIEGASLADLTYMIRGKRESGFSGVGLLQLRNPDDSLVPHCTGALVSARTVLTAAHCVYDEKRPMVFYFGGDPRVESGTTIAVEDPVYPKGEGFTYDAINHTDDVALVYLVNDAPASFEHYALHKNAPPLADLEKGNVPLVFIGYGASVYDSTIGLGAKRRLDLGIETLSSRSFSNDTLEGNTCLGDSGGPVLAYNSQNGAEIVGVVSRGDAKCIARGVNTRIDAIQSWILPRIR
jgi:V8-like Glu-specific endopeptidase